MPRRHPRAACLKVVDSLECKQIEEIRPQRYAKPSRDRSGTPYRAATARERGLKSFIPAASGDAHLHGAESNDQRET
jgi:hypothetical protein